MNGLLNQAILVGRVWDMSAENYIIISVPRSYKNEDGEYENDMIKVTLEGKINDMVTKAVSKALGEWGAING